MTREGGSGVVAAAATTGRTHICPVQVCPAAFVGCSVDSKAGKGEREKERQRSRKIAFVGQQ